MHFEETHTDNSEARILPLINVVFLLLIFFMVAGSLSVTEPFHVEPPQSASGDAGEQDVLRILLGFDGQLALDGEVVDEKTLLALIKERLASEPKPGVQLKADGRIAGNRIVLLTEDLRGAGVEELRLLTLPVKP
uniref:Outer membrane transport energization protein ExbD n=1 Tax=Candidatus Kentrum sp. FW TaxID=2126338 RepID=A0A450SF59_9GAMM|nr:MAG: outer membrane transport energization protein ExbD [Candidatus Kentron sp. FW]VFJ57632.1 MAG: outer membrane transport energization protein ExbD [Candidatus Kentron sp. FW]